MVNKSSDTKVLEGAWKRALADEHIKEDVLFYANSQTFDADPCVAAYNQGIREAALRILGLSGVIE